MSVMEKISTVGYGPIVLAGNVGGYTRAHATLNQGDVVEYTIMDRNNYEIGTGTYSVGQITRNPRESFVDGQHIKTSEKMWVREGAVVGLADMDKSSLVKYPGTPIPKDIVGNSEKAVKATTRPNGGIGISKIMSLTQAQYDAIPVKATDTLYVIVED